ncbi:MAG: phosphocholine cytidylyltransferase family protein [Prevotellaceae bacterium]|jgi:choline kinase|nr:phosphocholine cytidylyltransferase family protein [Prevotellaceae bacterium]
MKVIILAAGRGSRMGKKTANLPKCLMELGGKTLLERCIDTLQAAGIESSEIAIVTGYRREAITIKGVHYFHNDDWENTNMFVSLTKASEWLTKEPCIVSYADIVFSPDVIRKLDCATSEFAITYYTGFWKLWSKRFENPLDDLETFKMQDGKLVEIGMKPFSKEDVQGQYMGLLRFTPSGWEKIEEAIKLPMPKTVAKLDMTTLLQHLINHGNTIETIGTDDLWLECDNQNDIEVYEKEYSWFLYK